MAADRAVNMEGLRLLPQAMRQLPQWLLWRFEPGDEGKKPRKVPHYVGGMRRTGKQGSEADRTALATFEQALHRLERGGGWEGLGFAFLPGDGLIGIDIDGAIDADGVVSERCTQIVQACGSYTEYSPSGRGVHIIVQGETTTFKSDAVGVEVFCGSQYFTCTGRNWQGVPAEAEPIAAETLAWLRTMVKGQGAPARAAPAAAAPADSLAQRLEAAVLAISPDVHYRDWVQVGMGLKHALGEAGQRLWDDWSSRGAKYPGADALSSKWASFQGGGVTEATVFKLAMDAGWRPPRQPGALRLVHRAEADATAAPAVEPDIGPDPPPAHPIEENEGGGPPRRTRRSRGGSGGTGGAGAANGGGGVLAKLLEHYALVRGTSQVWDGEMRCTVEVKNLRLLYGPSWVSMWLAHPERRVLLPEQIRFEPGVELPPPCVNIFDGLPTTPKPCTESDVEPILDLLRHLTSLSMVRDKTGALLPAGEQVFDQVVKWCALIVQRPGAKLRFAQVFHGPQGTGKNLFWDAFRRILGKYGKMVGQTELEDRFNGYMSGKLLLIGNEVVTRQELFHNKNKLKWVITEDEIPIRGMHQEVRWESNHANLVFLSNELQPVALEKDDRRHLIVYTPAGEDPALYARVVQFLADDGHAKFLHWLLQVDLGDFNEHTKPMMTVAKESLIEMGLRPAERFAQEWLDGFLDLPLQVCSNTQLFRVFTRWCSTNGERNYAAQSTFTKTVERYVFERVERDAEGRKLPAALAYKQIALLHTTGGRKTHRCWIPRGTAPPNGITEGEWAGACIDAFERVVARFGREAGEAGNA